MKTWKTKNGYEIFGVLGGTGNAYLICTENGNLLVDTGRKAAFRRLKRNISTLNPDLKSIHFLILTHSHYDHCQNAHEIQKRAGCRVIMSAHEAEFARSGLSPLPDGTNPFTRIISFLGKKCAQKVFKFSPFIPVILVEDDLDLKSYGFNIRIIHTKGHSKGSISVLIDDEIAIVGDTMFGVCKNSIFPPFADDIPEMINSWGKLLKTDCQIFLPGHGKVISRELVQNEFERFSRKQPLQK